MEGIMYGYCHCGCGQKTNIALQTDRRRGYIFEHHLVIEEEYNCQLPKGSVVHHVDGNGLNNSLPNLMVFKDQSEHLRFHKLQERLTNNFKSV